MDSTLQRIRVEALLAGLPVREFRSYRGRRHYSGWYWSATTGGHVVYENRLELARILLADRDPDVVAIAAQPFLLEEQDGARIRRHVPDLLLGHANGSVTVVDVKAPKRCADPAIAEQVAWTRRACEQADFGFEVWSGADPVVLENVRFLAGYRRAAWVDQKLVPSVLGNAASPVSVLDLEMRMADHPRELTRPVILHLLWLSRLVADLSQPLDGDTVVRTEMAA
ncbi:MAG: TnsA-like heteromeric transposase endonuclease subunit [Pseudonocardia sp.]|nr:TnsA-like heteromeric transposase endonuclease subunit [Pseudonocardia sp.]